MTPSYPYVRRAGDATGLCTVGATTDRGTPPSSFNEHKIRRSLLQVASITGRLPQGGTGGLCAVSSRRWLTIDRTSGPSRQTDGTISGLGITSGGPRCVREASLRPGVPGCCSLSVAAECRKQNALTCLREREVGRCRPWDLRAGNGHGHECQLAWLTPQAEFNRKCSAGQSICLYPLHHWLREVQPDCLDPPPPLSAQEATVSPRVSFFGTPPSVLFYRTQTPSPTGLGRLRRRVAAGWSMAAVKVTGDPARRTTFAFCRRPAQPQPQTN